MTEKQDSLLEQANLFERKAHQLMEEQKIQQSFEAFDKAAMFYRDGGEHLKSAMCYASAATCWNIHTNTQPVKNAATRNHYAALEAVKAKGYDYARSLFREAAIHYEKEGDGENYSACFMGAQLADAQYAWEIFTGKKTDSRNFGNLLEIKIKDRVTAFFRWIFNNFSRFLWGYGERPFRTFLAAGCVIFACAVIYRFSGQVIANGVVRAIDFGEALYFSVITFATVGYGDYLPAGWVRIVSIFEGLSGIFLAPLFLVALTRRYLRMYR